MKERDSLLGDAIYDQKLNHKQMVDSNEMEIEKGIYLYFYIEINLAKVDNLKPKYSKAEIVHRLFENSNNLSSPTHVVL